MKIVTWNVNSLRVRLEQVLAWLESNPVDILCLQELKMADEEFPLQQIRQQGYHAEFYGQKTYNGVAILSKQVPINVFKGMDGYEDESRRYLACDFLDNQQQKITVINVYVPNGQSLDSEKFSYKRYWFSHLHERIKQQLQIEKNLVLVGDFNIALTDLDVHDCDKWRGEIHCSPIERLMLHKLMALGLYDVFRITHPNQQQYSWWDYRSNAYNRDEGLRIDLILASGAMLDCFVQCDIDETPRKLERPSDHTPVIAEFDAIIGAVNKSE